MLRQRKEIIGVRPSVFARWNRGLRKLQAADTLYHIHENFGPRIISLTEDESFFGSCGRKTCNKFNGVLKCYRRLRDRSLEPVMNFFDWASSHLGADELPNIDDHPIEIEQRFVSEFHFKLGTHSRHFSNTCIVDTPERGKVQTYTTRTSNGVGLEVFEVDIPDIPDISKPRPEQLSSDQLDVHGIIFNMNCASALWIDKDITKVIILKESEPENAEKTECLPQQWFRKILSDFKLVKSILDSNKPSLWDPVVLMRLEFAVRTFKKMFMMISDQSKDDCTSDRCKPNQIHGIGRPSEYEFRRYWTADRSCSKAMVYLERSQTIIRFGDFHKEGVRFHATPKVVSDLYDDWLDFQHKIQNSVPFEPVNDIICRESEQIEQIELERQDRFLNLCIKEHPTENEAVWERTHSCVPHRRPHCEAIAEYNQLPAYEDAVIEEPPTAINLYNSPETGCDSLGQEIAANFGGDEYVGVRLSRNDSISNYSSASTAELITDLDSVLSGKDEDADADENMAASNDGLATSSYGIGADGQELNDETRDADGQELNYETRDAGCQEINDEPKDMSAGVGAESEELDLAQQFGDQNPPPYTYQLVQFGIEIIDRSPNGDRRADYH